MPFSRFDVRGFNSFGLAFAAAALAAVIVLSYLWLSNRPNAGAPVRSIAVLPFKPLMEGGSENYLGVGMADALITRLSNLRQISVRPTGDILKYADATQEPLAIGRDLNVDSLLDGRVQRDGDKIRVTVQLVNVRDGTPLWAGTFDEMFTNIFAVQDSISEQVTQALTLKLTREEEKLLTKRHTENTEAYRLYLMGRYFWNQRTEESLMKGISYFEQAAEKDPGYALAYAGIADSYVILGSQEVFIGNLAPREALPRAKRAVIKALELDDTLAGAHASLGAVRLYENDWVGAEKAFNRSIELDPRNVTAPIYYSITLMLMGRTEEALAHIEAAQEIEPLSLMVNANLGAVLCRGRQYDRAIKQLRKTLEMYPNFSRGHWLLGLSYEQKGMYEEAISEFHRVIEISGDRPLALAALAHAHAVSGDKAKAKAILKEMEEMSDRRYVPFFHVAVVYAGLGEKERAISFLEKAYEKDWTSLPLLKVEQRLDPMRSDPRFEELLRRTGLSN